MAIRATITASTHPGLVRAANQDTVAVGEWVGTGTLWRPRTVVEEIRRPLLCAVADGMGSYAGSGIASDLVVRSLVAGAERMTGRADVDFAIADANRALRGRALSEPALRDMGTTVVGLLLLPERLIWFNIGDSRLYQYRDGFLRQFSVDDVNQSPGSHGPRQSHTINQWLGEGSFDRRLDAHVGIDEPALAPSRWLLCSDGLTDMLSRAQMEEAMRGSDREAWLDLFGGAMEAGAEDNVSIVIVTIEEIGDGDGTHG